MKVTITLLLAILIFSQCSENFNDYSDSLNSGNKLISTKETLNIVGHWLNEGKRERLVKELANEFEFLNQEYVVNLKFPEEIYYTREKANCEFEFIAENLTAKESKWDIIRINNANLEISAYMKEPLWAQKYLVDFSKENSFSENTIPELINDSVKNYWGGIIPGPFLEGFNWTLWYNKALAEKVGIKIKQMDMTFDDLLEYVKVIDNYNKSHNTQIIPIHDCSDWTTIEMLASRLYLSALDNLKECFENSYNETKLAAVKKTLEAFEQLSHYHAFETRNEDMAWGKTQDFPLQHKSFFYMNASWMYNIWQKINDNEVKNMVPTELPVFKPSPIYFGGYQVTWAVPKNAKHKEAALKFLSLINRPAMADKWGNFTKCPTGIKGNISSSGIGYDHFEEFTQSINKKYNNRKIGWFSFAVFVAGKSHVNAKMYVKEVALGKMKVGEAMQKIRADLSTVKY